MIYLVDTNVISELARHAPNPGVLAWAEQISKIALSVVTVEEICFGLARKPNPRIQNWFEAFFATQCLILPITEEVARSAGQLRGRLAARGIVRTQADMLIAATAQVHGHTLVTRNVRDFEECSIGLLDPLSKAP